MIAQEAWEIDRPSRDAWVAVLRHALVPAVVKAPKQWPGWHLTAGITIDAATMYVALWEPGAPRPKELVMGRLGPLPTIVLFLEFVGSSAIHGREMRSPRIRTDERTISTILALAAHAAQTIAKEMRQGSKATGSASGRGGVP